MKNPEVKRPSIPETDTAPRPYSWRYVIDIALKHRRALVLAHIFAICGTLATIPIPLLMPLMVDEVLLGQPGPRVAFIGQWFPESWRGPILFITAPLIATILLRLLALRFSAWEFGKFAYIAKNVTYRMRREMLTHLGRISMAEYETLGSGAVTAHFVTDLEVIDRFVGTTVGKFLVAVLTLIGIAMVLIWLHWPLALFILFVNPVVIYCTILMGKKIKELKTRENAAFEHFQETLAETLNGILQIRAANREGYYLTGVIERARRVRDSATAFSWRSDVANRLSLLIFVVGFDIFRAVSMLLVLFSDLSLGEMMAVFGYLWYMMSPVQEVLNIQYAYFGARAALGRVNRLVDLKREPSYPHKTNPFANRDTVGLRVANLGFAYGDGLPVLDRLSLTIAPGEKVALVGASGGGKSTFVQILLGLYPARSGMIFFDGGPVTEIGLDVVREHVGVVLQHPALFNDTVRNNLSLGRQVPDGMLWRALEIAQLKGEVERMPEGLDSLVGRQGIRLSGGQRQRLAVARMILTDPKIVILDEATSSLDTETESRLHEAMQAFLQGRTTLIVAHRLSAVKQADRVCVFEGGRIMEEGRHTELLESGGLYSRLYGERQMA
uniref:ATP-binding cassette, subfamily C n=1 Tax=Candidatus Kentrum eta TaxID=2126337 RepID=A0A450VHM0_9GAMM|nr:MAG: ATP-binding cassette, subfamily C [Candidatus Kentron sp. H]VFJ98749.1 MAG: ATP-binding cassette, subfamily C [Candidatus Kentron sp. H]VFK04304.1 MAG: ATP-binding cassette, subfamily C [Candidatus Kentron sp. H]